jgi:hypothetical protein
LIALVAAVLVVGGIISFAVVYFTKPSLLSLLPFLGENGKVAGEHQDTQKAEESSAVAAGLHPDKGEKTEEHPETLRQSSAEQPIVTAASDFIRPKSQTSLVGQAMREISALQARLAQGAVGSPQELKASMLRAEKIFTSNHAMLESNEDIQSLAQYVLSGGNPSVASGVLQNPKISAQHKDLVQGVVSYATADLAKAREKLLPLDGKRFNKLLDAQLTMVQVQLEQEADTGRNLERLSYVANIVPGTLIEEAAIRRMIALLARPNHSKNVLYWTSRYLRRFSNSLYYQDFETSFIDAVVQYSRDETKIQESLLGGMLSNADEKKAESLSRKILLAAVESGNTELCGSVQNSLAKTSLPISKGFADSNALIEMCKVSQGNAGVLQSLRKIDQSDLSESVRINLNKAIEMAEAIQNEITLKDDGQFGPHLPLSQSEGYDALFASVAQQIGTSISAIEKADDNETGFNK